MTQKEVALLKKVFKKAKTILLTTHRNPDGDGVGSGVGLMSMLLKFGKKIDFVTRDPVPFIYNFLPYYNKIKKLNAVKKKYDVVVFLECPDKDRNGKIIDFKKNAKLTVNIDHHLGNTKYADINIIDSEASAVGMQLFEFFKKAGWKIDLNTAIGLYTAIITDTGSFNFANTTPQVHNVVAELIEMGVKPSFVSSNVYATSFASTKLMSLMLSKIKIQNGIGFSVLTRKMFEKTGAQDSETDNFINLIRNIRTVKIAVLFKEYGPKVIKVSFRSKTGFDVNRVASIFDGGGHKYAAGCIIHKNLKETISIVLSTIKKQYRKLLNQ
ncbi:MAG: bifunctional oligoribonuclease/PAP phosphatase NrnA [Candidatus Goldbacteria bacterium]|nr:bifunctional oligoribonuclease/PAP phosphatase NrnA [Candidatus Goldiibacteriota bacterium]